MGNWHISIQGTGIHHNYEHETGTNVVKKNDDGSYKQAPNDADKMTREFVQQLKAAGHNVEIATFTHGGRENAL